MHFTSLLCWFPCLLGSCESFVELSHPSIHPALWRFITLIPGSTRQGQMAGLPGPLQNGSVMVICVLCVLISIDHFVSTHRRGDQTWLGKHLWLQWHRHETIISPAPISHRSHHNTTHIPSAHAHTALQNYIIFNTHLSKSFLQLSSSYMPSSFLLDENGLIK